MSETEQQPFEAKAENLWDFEDIAGDWLEIAMQPNDRFWFSMSTANEDIEQTVILPRYKVIELVAWLESRLEATE